MINLEINTNETGDLSTTFKAYDKITAKIMASMLQVLPMV